MPAEPLPLYSFLPWSRRGIAVQIDQTDDLGEHPDAGPAGRATVTAEITVESVPVPGAPATGPTAVSHAVQLVGPGDIGGFKPGTVLRSVPEPNSLNATPGELAFVEFYDEDFPWRYTPARATDEHALRPWVALFVLADGEYELVNRPGESALLTVHDNAPLPLPTETWAWAHVQVAGALAEDGTDLDAFVGSAPDHALSRLVCPRRLRPRKNYRAFVVPAFETARMAGLGTPDLTVKAQRPSWGSGQPRRFPVLHDWSFHTGDVSDFESLARRPKPFGAGQSFGKRPLDVSDPGAGLPASQDATVELEGALQPVRFQRTGYPEISGTELAGALQRLVDTTEDYRDETPQVDDPVVVPPAYGRAPAGLRRVADTAAVPALSWVAELNLDPRNRAAAGLGAHLVRSQDERLMERAWAQVGALDVVNQRLREADLAMAASERIFAKHVAGSDPDRVLALTAAAHSGIALAGSTTIRGQIDLSRVPAAAQAPAFRRISRPTSRMVRKVIGDQLDTLRTGLVEGLNADPGTGGALSTAPPPPDPAAGVDLGTVVRAATAAAVQQVGELPKPREQFLFLAYDELHERAGSPAGLVPVLPTSLTPNDLNTLADALTRRLDGVLSPSSTGPKGALRQGVVELVGAIKRVEVPAVGTALMSMDSGTFTKYFGDAVEGKTYRGVTAFPDNLTAPGSNATATDPTAVARFVSDLTSFATLSADRPAAEPADPLHQPTAIATTLAERLRPRTALPARLATVLRGVDVDLTAQATQARRLAPVLAYPTFDDPLFEELRAVSQDYVLPNIADLPPESIAVMEPNNRFIESLLVGANTELARELLWNEYPTDQRGTYFARFWDTRDAGVTDPPNDIRLEHTWDGDLGTHAVRTSGLLVLVVRAELLAKFPNTIVFAQQAAFSTGATAGAATGMRGRVLDDTGTVHYPVLRGHLDPDIELYGFELTAEAAIGSDTDAGYFFCLMERPGQVRFGLDLDEPAPELSTWDDLAWAHLVGDPEQVLVTANAGLQPTTANLPGWGLTSAHLAAILCQNPVLLARHASDMLPVPAGPAAPASPPGPTS